MSFEILIMMLLLTLTITSGHILRKYKVKTVSEAFLATIYGLICGFLLKLLGEKSIIENITEGYVKFFLILLLPPIIFEA